METSGDAEGFCSAEEIFDETGNRSAKSESLASGSSIQDLSESVKSANSTFSTSNVDSSNQKRVVPGSRQKTANTSSSSTSKQSANTSSRSVIPKPPSRTSVVTKSNTKSEKLSSATTTKSSTFTRTTSIRSERKNSLGYVSKSFNTENKTKTSLPVAKVQSRRFSYNTKSPNTSTTDNKRRNSLSSGQIQDINQTKKEDHISQSKVKGQDKSQDKGTVPIKTKNTDTIVSQSKRLSLQSSKTNIHQSQIKDSDATKDQKRFGFNKSPVINLQNSKQNLQSQTKLQNRSQYSTRKSDLTLNTGNISSTSISKPDSQSDVTKKSEKQTNISQNEEKLSDSSSEQISGTYLPPVNKTVPESSISAKNEILGKCVKESANQLPQETKNGQTANKNNLIITNRSQEELSLAITSPVSENSDAAAEFSKDQSTSCISSKPVKFSNNEEKVIGELENIESLTGNEKFSVDEVKNSSMISEKGNEDPFSNPEDSEISTIIFDTKTLLEPENVKDFSYCLNQQNDKETILGTKKISMKSYQQTEQIVMEAFVGARKTSMTTYQQIEQTLAEILFQARQVSLEHYYQVEQAVFLLCSNIEKGNIEERLKLKREVEKLQYLLGNEDKEVFQAKELGEISQKDESDETYTERKHRAFKQNEKEKSPKREEYLNPMLQHREVNSTLLPIDAPKQQTHSNGNRVKMFSTLHKTVPAKELKKYLEGVKVVEESKESLDSDSSEFVVDGGEAEESKNFIDFESKYYRLKKSVKDEIKILASLVEETSERSEETEELKKSLQTFLQASQRFSEKSEFEILSLKNKKKEIVSSLENKKESDNFIYLTRDEAVEKPFLYNVNEIVGKSSLQSKKDIEIALQDEREVAEILCSLQNERVDISFLQNEEVACEILSLQNDKDIQLPLQFEKKSIDMSYLPNNEAVELPFLKNLKEAIGKNLEKEKEKIEKSLQDLKEFGKEFLQNKTIEISSQNEDKMVEKAIQCEKDKMPTLQNSKDIQSSLQIERESIDMSYLPNNDAVEMPFLKNLKKRLRKYLRKEKNNGETYLQDEEVELSQTAELFSQSEEDDDQISLHCEESVDISLHETDSEKSSLHEEEEDTEISLDENKTVVISLQNNKDIQLSLQIERETSDMSYLPKDESIEMPILKNGKDFGIVLQKENDYIDTLQNVEKVIKTSQNEVAAVQIALKCEKAVEMSLLHEKGDIEKTLPENKTVEMSSLQNNKDVQLPLQIEEKSVDMSYLPNDDSVELPFLQNIKETVVRFSQKEDFGDTNLQNVKVTETSQNEEEEVVELSSQNPEQTSQIALQHENEKEKDSETLSLYEENEDIEISLQDKKADTSLYDKVDKILHDEKSDKMSFLHDKAVQNFLQSQEPVEISLHKEKSDKEISLQENEETNDMTSPNRKEVIISYLHEQEVNGMSLLQDKEVFEKPLSDKIDVESSIHDKDSVEMLSLSDEADKISFLHDTETVEMLHLNKKDENENSIILEDETISISENKADVILNKSAKNIDNNTKDNILVQRPHDETSKSESKDPEKLEKVEISKFRKINENEVQNKSLVSKESILASQNDGIVGLSDSFCQNKTAEDGESEKCIEVINEEASCTSQKIVSPNNSNQKVCAFGTESSIGVLDFPKKKDTETLSNILNKEISPDKVKLPDEEENILPDHCIPSDEEIQHGFKEETIQNALNFLINETID